MSERKRIVSTSVAVSLVGIVTGLFLGGGLLPSATDQQYDERTTTTTTTETSISHSHDGIPPHEHTIPMVITITETTPHFWFHNFAPATTPSPGEVALTQAKTSNNEVLILGKAYLPSTITVPVGTTVTWTNKDLDSHTVTGIAGSLDINSGSMSYNDTYRYTFTKPGVYTYYCEAHTSMLGTVIVE